MPLKFVTTFFLALIFVSSSSAQVSKTEVAVGVLQRAHPSVKWNSDSAKVADVTCDGKPDTILVGSEKDNVVIGVVSGAYPNDIQIFPFAIAADNQWGFCAFPKRIEISPLDCKSKDGSLKVCEPIEGCRKFTVIDDQCDPFNFYWDASLKRLQWWRN
jgi:hypothetical protein